MYLHIHVHIHWLGAQLEPQKAHTHTQISYINVECVQNAYTTIHKQYMWQYTFIYIIVTSARPAKILLLQHAKWLSSKFRIHWAATKYVSNESFACMHVSVQSLVPWFKKSRQVAKTSAKLRICVLWEASTLFARFCATRSTHSHSTHMDLYVWERVFVCTA